jgi:hypothetical protein
MNLPSLVGTALSSATGFGNVFMLFYCRTHQPATNYIYQNVGANVGGGAGSILAGGQRGYCYVENAVTGTGGNTATITRRGIVANSMSAEVRYPGAMNSHVEGLLFSGTQVGVYLDGLVKYAAAPASFTSGSNCLGQSSGFTGSIRSVIVGKGIPTLADLQRFERFMRRGTVRKVVFVGNSILGNIITGPPSGSFPWFVEQQLGARYSVENQCIPAQRTGEMLARFDSETLPRLRRGDVVVFHEILNSLGASETSNTVLGYVRSLCDKCKTIGVIPIINTCMSSSALTGGGEAARQVVNTALKAAPTDYSIHASGIVRFDEVTEAQTPGNATYFVDGTHPTSALHAILAPLVAAAIKALAPV